MLGAKAGLPPTTFDSVVRGGRMDCGFYQTFFKYVIERDENAHQFTIANALKDMTFISSFAVNAGRQPDTGGGAQHGCHRRGHRAGPALRPHSVRHRGGIERGIAGGAQAVSARRRAQVLVQPPSTAIAVPVISEASSLARNTTRLATSSGVPSRPIGCRARKLARAVS